MVSHRSGLPRIVAIGAGNVASHLIPAIEAAGVGEVAQVYSRTLRSANALASRLWNAQPIDSTDAIIKDADIYIVSLADNAVASVLSKLKPNNALWLHTSGSLPLSVLSGLSLKTGVFYPLQTFSKETRPEMSRIPLFIEGSTPGVEAQIREIGQKVFSRVVPADSDLRRKMHVAAVFACNFTNYLWTVADDLLRQSDLDLSVLHPLLEETLRKAETISGGPAAGQTGPAMRGDEAVMKAHEAMLPENLADIYSRLSRAIMERHVK
ncbi:MAG: DUF2520 domain-containing protein [Muribaculaceae bacterium]|nr:DUF2520 domain-containing protein [Muribaculaceae bacterium]